MYSFVFHVFYSSYGNGHRRVTCYYQMGKWEAIRAEVLENFAGIVKGSVKGKSGMEHLFELCEANQYSTNLELPPGNYQLSIDATEKNQHYKVLYDEEFVLEESEIKIANLQVTGECTGTIKESEDMESSENTSQTEQMKTDTVSKEVLKLYFSNKNKLSL